MLGEIILTYDFPKKEGTFPVDFIKTRHATKTIRIIKKE